MDSERPYQYFSVSAIRQTLDLGEPNDEHRAMLLEELRRRNPVYKIFKLFRYAEQAGVFEDFPWEDEFPEHTDIDKYLECWLADIEDNRASCAEEEYSTVDYKSDVAAIELLQNLSTNFA